MFVLAENRTLKVPSGANGMMIPSVTIPNPGSNRRLLVSGRVPTPDQVVKKPLPTGIADMLTTIAVTDPSEGISARPPAGTVISDPAPYGPSGTPALSTGNRGFSRESRIRVGLTGTYAPP